MFAVAVAPLLFTFGAPRSLLDCQNTWTGYYLAISATGNAVFRLAMWESGYHETVKIYDLSRLATQQLDGILKRTEREGCTKYANTAIQLPPLYPPLLERLLSYYKTVLHTISGIFGYKPGKTPLVHDSKNHTRASTKRMWRGVTSALTNPLSKVHNQKTQGAKSVRSPAATGHCPDTSWPRGAKHDLHIDHRVRGSNAPAHPHNVFRRTLGREPLRHLYRSYYPRPLRHHWSGTRRDLRDGFFPPLGLAYRAL